MERSSGEPPPADDSKAVKSLPKAASNGLRSSIRMGTTGEELFSAANSFTVYRYVSWYAIEFR